MKLYLVRLFDPQSEEYFFKIGVTGKSVKERFAYGSQKVIDSNLSLGDKLKTMISGVKYIPDCEYLTEELHSVGYTYDQDALLGEEKLLKTLNHLSYRPQKHLSGATECFKPAKGKEEECIARVRAMMNADSQQRNEDAPDELKYKVLSMLIRERDPMKRHLAIIEKHRQERV